MLQILYRQCLRTAVKSSYTSKAALLSLSPAFQASPVAKLQPFAFRSLVTSPTLGPNAPDMHTKLTNPFKDDKGNVLRIKLSERAAEKLNSVKVQDSNPNLVLRVAVESGGCHGFQYLMSLKDKSTINNEEDSVFERDGAQVVIDQSSLEVLQQSTIDYTTELIGSQFRVVDSPFTSSSCGCGQSFSFDPSK